MTNQPQITADELVAKWSNLLNQAFIRIITLEKQVAELEDLKSSPQVAADKAVYEEMMPRPLSEAERAIAAQGSAIIADGK